MIYICNKQLTRKNIKKTFLILIYNSVRGQAECLKFSGLAEAGEQPIQVWISIRFGRSLISKNSRYRYKVVF